MQDSNKSELDKKCEELSGAFKGVLSWKWDDRFETVLAEFSTDKKNSVREILDRYLRHDVGQLQYQQSAQDHPEDQCTSWQTKIGTVAFQHRSRKRCLYFWRLGVIMGGRQNHLHTHRSIL